MLFLPLNIEEKIAISILGEEIEVRWSRFYSIIAYRGKYRCGLEMLLVKKTNTLVMIGSTVALKI